MNSIMKKGNGTGMPGNLSGMADHFFQNNLSRLFDDSFWGFDGNLSTKQVPVNVKETTTSYELEMVAPGLKKEDFKININGDMLTVSFAQKDARKEEDRNGKWLRSEYKMQSFTRSFGLDNTIDANKISAKYADGILFLSLPKKEEAQQVTKTIEIQ